MPIPFLSSINLTKNEVENFKIYNLANDPGTLTSGGDFGYFWLNTSGTKTLKWWDGANVRSIVDSTNIGSYTSGLATDLAGGGAGQIVYQNAANDTMFLSAGTSGQVLSSNGTSAPSWLNQSSLSVGSATTATTANAVANALTAGTYLTSGGTFDGSVARTFAVDATDANTASKVVARDASGNFAAGTITATRVTGLSAPSAGSDAANRDYVDGVAQGLDVKASCLVATTADITLASPGAVTIDGIYSATDFTAGTTRILVKDQSAPAENGIYIWQGPSSAMTRSSDANTWDELVGAFTFIERGTANADSGWVCTVNAGGTLGSTAVTFVKFSQAGSYTQGRGMVLDGTAFNFAQNTDYTAGRIPFASGPTTIGFNANLHWDNSNNRLGIGTATPAELLHAYGAAPRAMIENSANNGIYLRLKRPNKEYIVALDINNNGGNDFTIWDNTAAASRFSIASDGVCTWSNVGGNSGTAMTLNGTGLGIGTATISERLTVSGNVLATDSAGTYPRFISTVGAKSWEIGYRSGTTNYELREDGTTRLVVANGGNVGIGTATPSGKLHVEGANIVLKNGTGVPFFQIAGRNTDGRAEFNFLNNGLSVNNAKLVGYTNTLAFEVAGTERLRIDSSGNVGIGTTTPAYKLDVNGSINATTTAGISITSSSNSTLTFKSAGSATPFYYFLDSSRNLIWQDNATERMTLSSSGNLGLGVTPSAWGASLKALQVGAVSYGSLFDFGNGVTSLSSNLFFSGSSYGRMSTSSRWSMAYWQDITNGAHSWVTSTAAGTNASTPTMSTLMLLDASGNLGLGVTPKTWSAYKPVLQVGLSGAIASTLNSVSLASNWYFDGNDKYMDAYAATLYQQYNGGHYWYRSTSTPVAGNNPNFVAAMTLDASGNLLLGTTTSVARLHVVDNSTNVQARFASSNNNGTSIQFYNTGTGGRNWQIGSGFAVAAGNFEFYDITAAANRLSIKSTGQVNFVGLASDPAGAAGDVVYNSTSNRLKYHNGTAWVDSGTRKVSVVGGAGTGTYIDATHNFNTKTVSVTVLRTTDNVVVYTDVAMTNDNTVRVTFASSVTLADYTVTVIG